MPRGQNIARPSTSGTEKRVLDTDSAGGEQPPKNDENLMHMRRQIPTGSVNDTVCIQL